MYHSDPSELSNATKYISPAALKAEKRFFIWLNLQPTSPLTFADDLIFSIIARKPASQRSLAKQTGLCRKRTIPQVIDKLSAMRLCECREGLYSALEPEHLDWWQTWDNQDAKRWQDKLIYFKIYRPKRSSKITVRQAAVFSKILDWSGQQASYYATCLCLPRRTVFDQLPRLRSMGLITGDGCRVPDSIPDLWLSKPSAASVVTLHIRKFFDGLTDAWFMNGQAVKKIEETSEVLASQLGHTPKYLRRYWTDTFVALEDSHRIEAFVRESGKIAAHVIAQGKTRKYLKTTTNLVIQQLADWPLDRIWHWYFDPATLLKSL